jgi:hypothetical protein
LLGGALQPPDATYTYTSGATLALVYSQKIMLSQGTDFILKSGGAKAEAVSSSVKFELLDVTSGTSVSAGTSLTAGHRYIVPEHVAAAVNATGDAEIYIIGYYKSEAPTATPTPTPTPTPASLPFTDVTADDWFHAAVEFVYARSYFKGTSDTEFSPQTSMNRAMFVTVLYRVSGETSNVSEFFPDFPDASDSSQYYYAAVRWAAANDIVNGYDDGLFHPERNISREQMAALIYRYATLNDTSTPPDALGEFTDAGSVSDWARDAVNWAVSLKIINGMGDGTLMPQNTSTRAQVAQVIMKYVQLG